MERLKGQGALIGYQLGQKTAIEILSRIDLNEQTLELEILKEVDNISISFIDGFCTYAIAKHSRAVVFDQVTVHGRDKYVLEKFSRYTKTKHHSRVEKISHKLEEKTHIRQQK